MPDLPDYYTQTAIAEAEAVSFDGGLDANKPDDPVSRDIYYATDTKILYVCVVDGTFININLLYLLLAGGTMTGAIAMGTNKITGLGDPTAAQDAATRAYVLATCGLYLPLTGGRMLGVLDMGGNAITLLANPVTPQGAATKAYVDDLLDLYLLLAGGTLTGPLIIANDTYIQIGESEGMPRLIPFTVTADSATAQLQPSAGNRHCFLVIQPKGTEDKSGLKLYNRGVGVGSDYSSFKIEVDGDTVTLIYEDAGTPPTSIAHVVLGNDWEVLNLKPVTDFSYSLGASDKRFDAVYAEKHFITKTLPANYQYNGLTTYMTAGAIVGHAQAAYVDSDGKMRPAFATGAATMPAIALAMGTIGADVTGIFLLQGFHRYDTWDWTPGGLLYVSKDTAGELTQTLPAASGQQVQVVGVAITADIIYWNPSYELVEIS